MCAQGLWPRLTKLQLDRGDDEDLPAMGRFLVGAAAWCKQLEEVEVDVGVRRLEQARLLLRYLVASLPRLRSLEFRPSTMDYPDEEDESKDATVPAVADDKKVVSPLTCLSLGPVDDYAALFAGNFAFPELKALVVLSNVIDPLDDGAFGPEPLEYVGAGAIPGSFFDQFVAATSITIQYSRAQGFDSCDWKRLSRLRSLTVGANIGDKEVMRALGLLPQLQTLNLDGGSDCTDGFLRRLAKHGHAELQHLDFWPRKGTFATMIAAISALPKARLVLRPGCVRFPLRNLVCLCLRRLRPVYFCSSSECGFTCWTRRTLIPPPTTTTTTRRAATPGREQRRSAPRGAGPAPSTCGGECASSAARATCRSLGTAEQGTRMTARTTARGAFLRIRTTDSRWSLRLLCGERVWGMLRGARED